MLTSMVFFGSLAVGHKQPPSKGADELHSSSPITHKKLISTLKMFS